MPSLLPPFSIPILSLLVQELDTVVQRDRRNIRLKPARSTTATTAATTPALETMAAAAVPQLLANIDHINAALRAALEQPPPVTGTLRVCEATEAEWNEFVDGNDHVVRPNYLEWFASTGEIHIVEFADYPHETFVYEFVQGAEFADRHIHQYLKGYNAATNSQGPRHCPDLSYGPRETTPGSVLPRGVPTWADFRTIKIEVGVSQQWGMDEGQLDHKALTIWATMPGVEYVLCVKFDADYDDAEYKLYDVGANPLQELDPLPIAAPRTVVEFDGRRILGIPPGTPLPISFPRTVAVDLYGPLRWAST